MTIVNPGLKGLMIFLLSPYSVDQNNTSPLLEFNLPSGYSPGCNVSGSVTKSDEEIKITNIITNYYKQIS